MRTTPSRGPPGSGSQHPRGAPDAPAHQRHEYRCSLCHQQYYFGGSNRGDFDKRAAQALNDHMNRHCFARLGGRGTQPAELADSTRLSGRISSMHLSTEMGPMMGESISVPSGSHSDRKCINPDRVSLSSNGIRKRFKSEEQRMMELARDPCIDTFGECHVECLGCGRRICLDSRSRYYPGLWTKHRNKCAGAKKILARIKGELPSHTARENRRPDALLKKQSTRRSTKDTLLGRSSGDPNAWRAPSGRRAPTSRASAASSDMSTSQETSRPSTSTVTLDLPRYNYALPPPPPWNIEPAQPQARNDDALRALAALSAAELNSMRPGGPPPPTNAYEEIIYSRNSPTESANPPRGLFSHPTDVGRMQLPPIPSSLPRTGQQMGYGHSIQPPTGSYYGAGPASYRSAYDWNTTSAHYGQGSAHAYTLPSASTSGYYASGGTNPSNSKEEEASDIEDMYSDE